MRFVTGKRVEAIAPQTQNIPACMALNVRSASAAMTIQAELAFRYYYRCRRLALAYPGTYYGSLAFSGGKPPTTRKAQSQEHRTGHCKYFFHLPPSQS